MEAYLKDYRKCGIYKNILKIKARENHLAFGDEGGAWACIMGEEEEREECEGCENYKCPYHDF